MLQPLLDLVFERFLKQKLLIKFIHEGRIGFPVQVETMKSRIDHIKVFVRREKHIGIHAGSINLSRLIRIQSKEYLGLRIRNFRRRCCCYLRCNPREILIDNCFFAH